MCIVHVFHNVYVNIRTYTRGHLEWFLFVVTSENPKDFSAKYIIYYSVQDKGDRSGGACNGIVIGSQRG